MERACCPHQTIGFEMSSSPPLATSSLPPDMPAPCTCMEQGLKRKSIEKVAPGLIRRPEDSTEPMWVLLLSDVSHFVLSRAGRLGIHQLPKQRGGVSDNRHPPASWSTKPNWRKLFVSSTQSINSQCYGDKLPSSFVAATPSPHVHRCWKQKKGGDVLFFFFAKLRLIPA